MLDLKILVSNLFLPLGSLVYHVLHKPLRLGLAPHKSKPIPEKLKIKNWMRGYITYILPLIVLLSLDLAL